MVLREVVETHLLIATRNVANAGATVSRFSRLIRSYRKLVRLVQAGDDVGAQKHWQAPMEGAGRLLLAGQLKSATLLDLFSQQAALARPGAGRGWAPAPASPVVILCRCYRLIPSVPHMPG